ncbi:MAG: hypothetical protein Q7T82_10345 [Armatimonadota bacterium]|nr:hypothetical protein [Armatimonadota bacterium]
MRKKRFVVGGLVAVCLAAFCPAPAVAAVWLSENFDSYQLGNLDGQGGWTGNPGAVRVENTFAQSGKAVRSNYKSYGSGEATRSVNSGGGYHTIDVDVAMNITRGADGYEGANLGKIYIRRSDAVEITRIYLADNQLKVRLADRQPVILTPVPNLTWQRVRLGINLTTGRMDVWVNGAQVLANEAVVNGATSISMISVGQWDCGSQFSVAETYVDNLQCSGALLPGTSALILSGTKAPGWERYNVCSPFVFYDAGAFKMYYSGSGTCQMNESVSDQWMTGLATSIDSLNWTRNDTDFEPVLYARKFYEGDLLDPDEQSAIFDSMFAIGACVIKDGPVHKMWYTGWNGDTEHIGGGVENKIDYRIGYATSTDGQSWAKHEISGNPSPVLDIGSPGQLDSKGVGQPYVLKEGSTYRMWYEGFDGTKWRIFYATSSDGISWTKQGVALGSGTAGSPDDQGVRNPVVIQRNGLYELWYQGRGSSSPNYHVLRATSSDGTVWLKSPTEIVLHPVAPPADEAVWTASDPAAEVYVDSIIVQADNSCQLFYTKEITGTVVKTCGTVKLKRLHIYTEVVVP